MAYDQAELEKEKNILRAMRKTLAQVVVDVTPDSSALQSPLKPQTIEDIRHCFGLISAREREIMDSLNRTNHDRPHFIDEPEKPNNVVHFQTSIQRAPERQGDEKGTNS